MKDSEVQKWAKRLRHRAAISARRSPFPRIYRQTLFTNDVVRLLQAVGLCCFYCGQPASPGRLCLDHVRPLSQGGENVIENVLPCCLICNSRKGNGPVELFINRFDLYHIDRAEFEKRYRRLMAWREAFDSPALQPPLKPIK